MCKCVIVMSCTRLHVWLWCDFCLVFKLPCILWVQGLNFWEFDQCASFLACNILQPLCTYTCNAFLGLRIGSLASIIYEGLRGSPPPPSPPQTSENNTSYVHHNYCCHELPNYRMVQPGYVHGSIQSIPINHTLNKWSISLPSAHTNSVSLLVCLKQSKINVCIHSEISTMWKRGTNSTKVNCAQTSHALNISRTLKTIR